jgi:hypothetical protein
VGISLTSRWTLAASPTTAFYGSAFLPHAGLVMWIDKIDYGTDTGEGWLANPDGCTGKRKFAEGVDYWFPVRDDALIYTDNGAAETADLRYAKLGPGGAWPAAASPTIRAGVGRVYGLLEPDRDYVVYVIANGGPDAGLYVHGPLGLGGR